MCIISTWSICLGVVSYNHDEFRLVAGSLIGKACGLRHLVGIIAHVGDACKFAGFNHALDFLFVGSPVWLEHARSSRHGEHIGKENVIIGKLIPAGTGLEAMEKEKEEREKEAEANNGAEAEENHSDEEQVGETAQN